MEGRYVLKYIYLCDKKVDVTIPPENGRASHRLKVVKEHVLASPPTPALTPVPPHRVVKVHVLFLGHTVADRGAIFNTFTIQC